MRNHKIIFLTSLITSAPVLLHAATDAPSQGGSFNAMLIGLLSLAVILLFAILVLANTLRQMGFVYRDKMREQKASSGSIAKSILLALVATISSKYVLAQDAGNIAMSGTIAGMAEIDFYLIMLLIAVELMVVFALSFQLRKIVKLISARPEIEEVTKPKFKLSFWDRFNSAVAIEKEEDILLDHDYDGIKELDNSLPPWWIYGFYFTIVVGVIYIWYYHAGGNGPSSYQEYVAEVEKGEEAKAAYLAKAANMVDENTVVMLDDAGIASGASIFKTTCAACHANDGGGGVGPNLTDEYWLHGGGIKDIFKSIKYGWPDKGMKSWKDDFSPKQIAELSSYIKSLKGTTPAAPKEKQGEVYIETEEQVTTDSTNKVAAN